MSSQSDLDDLLNLIGQSDGGEAVELELEPPDPVNRYHVQINQGGFGDGEEDWELIETFETVLEAVRGCSKAIAVVKRLRRISILIEVPGLGRGLRVWDAEWGVAIVWEDADGKLVCGAKTESGSI